jgi:hypothetical protein
MTTPACRQSHIHKALAWNTSGNHLKSHLREVMVEREDTGDIPSSQCREARTIGKAEASIRLFPEDPHATFSTFGVSHTSSMLSDDLSASPTLTAAA